jgi:hypothetical protein
LPITLALYYPLQLSSCIPQFVLPITTFILYSPVCIAHHIHCQYHLVSIPPSHSSITPALYHHTHWYPSSFTTCGFFTDQLHVTVSVFYESVSRSELFQYFLLIYLKTVESVPWSEILDQVLSLFSNLFEASRVSSRVSNVTWSQRKLYPGPVIYLKPESIIPGSQMLLEVRGGHNLVQKLTWSQRASFPGLKCYLKSEKVITWSRNLLEARDHRSLVQNFTSSIVPGSQMLLDLPSCYLEPRKSLFLWPRVTLTSSFSPPLSLYIKSPLHPIA